MALGTHVCTKNYSLPKLFLKQPGKEIPYALPFVSEAHTQCWEAHLYTPELETPGILNKWLFI